MEITEKQGKSPESQILPPCPTALIFRLILVINGDTKVEKRHHGPDSRRTHR
jgi:hypothetical protein